MSESPGGEMMSVQPGLHKRCPLRTFNRRAIAEAPFAQVSGTPIEGPASQIARPPRRVDKTHTPWRDSMHERSIAVTRIDLAADGTAIAGARLEVNRVSGTALKPRALEVVDDTDQNR